MAKAAWITAAGGLLALAATGAQAQTQVHVRVGHAYVSEPQVVVVQPQPVRTWVPGHWQQHGPSRVWVQGHWVVSHPAPAYHGHRGHWERQARWDQDRDGIPNRRDRDIDGDGVPNRYDRAPANPRWR